MDSDIPNANLVLDGYRLIRFLGRGGFGEVWLCRSEAMGGYHAIKFIAGASPELLEKEYHALALYRNAAAKLRSPHLVPIEHINRNGTGLYYVMPLADGFSDADPSGPSWQPLSLSALLQARATLPKWFSISEIRAILQPVLDALQTLSDAGLVHRDVKPENILFFNDSPCLGDISLLGEDASVITRRGTPGYATPSWYLGGLPDMFGAAATLYTLLTGNLPDKMGRAAFLWPPQGESSLSESEHAEWKRLHAVIRRATEEKVSERFVDFRTMAAAVAGAMEEPVQPVRPPPPLPTRPPILPARKRNPVPWVAAAVGILLVIVVLGMMSRPPRSDDPSITPSAPATPGTLATQPVLPEANSAAFEDAQTAYNSLTWIQNDLPSLGLTSDQHNLYQDTLSQIYPHIWSKEAFDPQQAVRKLDLCLSAVEGMRKIPNVMLARLLLLQSAGDSTSVEKDIGNPAFSTPGSDNLAYRVTLLCRLHAADKAEVLLDQVLAGPPISERKKSEALIQRAGVRVRLGKFAEARKDASSAVEAVEKDAALKASVEIKLLRLESDYPGYATYLKSQPEK